MSEISSVEELRNELSVLNNANYVSKITVQRGRLIRKIMIELAKLKKKSEKDEETLALIEKLESALENEIDKHKAQLDRRYKKEFLEEKATVPTIVTVLPKAVGLQINKVATCIEELIAAKNNKQRIFSVLSLGKALGMTVATPVIYAGKFIKEHWYLLLLLLRYINLPDFNGKSNSNNKSPEYNPAYEPALEPAVDPVVEPVKDPVREEVFVPNPDVVKEPVREPVPVPQAIDEPVTVPHAIEEPVAVPQAIDEPVLVPPIESPVPIEVLEQNSESISAFAKSFMDTLERDYSFFIKELHPDVTVVHSAEEFVEHYSSVTGRELDLSEAAWFYNHNIATFRPIDREVIWPEVDKTCQYFSTMTELMNHVMSGEDSALLDYFNRYTIPTEISFDLANSEVVNNLAKTLGISAGAAFTIILLKYAAQIGITYTTGIPAFVF